MFCKKCGEFVPNNARLCPSCGATQAAHNSEKELANVEEKASWTKRVTLKEAFYSYFMNFFDFKGKTPRRSFWLATLTVYVILFGSEVFLFFRFSNLGILLWTLCFIVAQIGLAALTVRRLRDAGHSLLFLLIPLATLIVFYLLSSAMTSARIYPSYGAYSYSFADFLPLLSLIIGYGVFSCFLSDKSKP